jgi:hypothetical protein
MYSCKYFDGYGLIYWEHLFKYRASIPGNDPSSLLILALLEINTSKSHEVFVEDLWALFFCEIEAVLPLATLFEHVQSREVTSFNDLVDLSLRHQIQLLLSLDLVNQHILQLNRADLTSTCCCTVPFLSLGEGFNSLIIVADRFKYFCCRLEPGYSHEARSNYRHDLLYPVLGIVHRNIESIHPYLLKMILVSEVMVSNL